MDINKINASIDKIEIGLRKYLNIMERLHQVDVSIDSEFQTKYNGFYRMRQRKPEFYKEYFKYIELSKKTELSYEEALKHFYDMFNRIEASFASKLVATINPNMPVWDEFVLMNLGLKKHLLIKKQAGADH